MLLKGKLTVAAVAIVAVSLLAAAAEAGEATTAPEYDAKFVRMEVPKKLKTDEVFKVVIVMRNTGTRSWGPANDAHGLLRSQDPTKNTTWGTNFIIQRQGTNCKVGKEFPYTSYLRAPHTPGEYSFQWRLTKRKGGAFFGEATAREVIQVVKRPEEPAPAPSAAGARVEAGTGLRRL